MVGTKICSFNTTKDCVQVQEGQEELLLLLQVRRGGHEEISLVQGKEQWLRFAGAAVNRYPMTKEIKTHLRPLVL